MYRSSLFLLAALSVAGCGKSGDTPQKTAAEATVTELGASDPVDSTASATKKNTCPATGRWALCSVEKRLEQSGFVVRRVAGESPRRAGFSVSPAVYTLGHSRLEVFIYSDEKALKRDIAGIDTLIAAPAGAKTAWESPPTFLRSANLAAVFLTDSRQRAERLTLALTAGPPQPATAVRLSPVRSR